MSFNEAGLEFVKRCGLDQKTVDDFSNFYKIPRHILLGVIKQESSGRARAMRFEPHFKYLTGVKEYATLLGWTAATEEALQKFSFGLMQIMLATARGHGFDGHPMNLLSPETNIAWGGLHLKRLFDKYQNWPDAIAAYNWGHPAKRFGGAGYKNQDYVDGVLAYAKEFET